MGGTQAERMLRAIQASGEEGVENYKLVQIALKYTSVISSLRQDGYDIRKRRVMRNGKPSGTYKYYLHVTIKPITYGKALSWLHDE